LTTADEQPENSRPARDADRDARIAARAERQRAQQFGIRRYRPGPAAGWNAAWRERPGGNAHETALDHEVETISRAVAEQDSMSMRELHREVGARYWGPGEFRRAVREALAENRITRRSRGRIGRPTEGAEKT
jgi:hypothetical protein